MFAFIITRAGRHVGVEELRDNEITIGRRKPSGPGRIALDDPTVSTNHAAATLMGDRWAIRDLGSRNGIQINGHTVPSGRDYLLNPGDKIAICDFTLTFANSPTTSSPKVEAFPSSFGAFDLKKVYAPTDVVGGDFFVHRVLDDDRLAVALGEAVGEGRPMGDVTLACADHVRRFAANGPPAKVMSDFHAAMGSFFPSGRVAVMFGILDSASCDFVYSCAGDLHTLLFNRNEPFRPRRMHSTSDALASGAAIAEYPQENRILLPPGENILLMTGGVLSAAPVTDPARDERLKAALLDEAASFARLELASMTDRLRARIDEIEQEARFFGMEGVISAVAVHGSAGVRLLVPALHRTLTERLDGHDAADDVTVLGIERAR